MLTEAVPSGIELFELSNFGGLRESSRHLPTTLNSSSNMRTRSSLGLVLVRIKRAVEKLFGQLADHRLLFAAQFLSPLLHPKLKQAITSSDVVFSTSPPWAIHLAAWIIKKRFNKPWLADYRDQFSENHIQVGSGFSRKIEVKIDRWLLRSADCVSVISSPMKKYYEQFHGRVICIENGFDENVFRVASAKLQSGEAEVTPEFIIRYIGSISSDRMPIGLLKAIVRLNKTQTKRLVVEFCGESSILRNSLANLEPDAIPYVRFVSQLTYVDAISATLTADLLYFVETSDFSSLSAKGVLTTKLFEYIAARKPIVAEINPRALAAEYITSSGLALVISESSDDIFRALRTFSEGRHQIVPNDLFIESLSRTVKAKELEALLHEMVAQ